MTHETGLDRSTRWPYVDGELGEFSYSRFDHPTGVEAEQALGALDGGHALLFASGMAAATAAVLALSAPGKTIALGEGCYYGTTKLFELLEPWGVRFVEFDQAGPPPDGADLVWIEIPGNPLLTVPDFGRQPPIRRPSSATRPPRRRSSAVRSSTVSTSSCTA